jgi:hypothetical protein
MNPVPKAKKFTVCFPGTNLQATAAADKKVNQTRLFGKQSKCESPHTTVGITTLSINYDWNDVRKL